MKTEAEHDADIEILDRGTDHIVVNKAPDTLVVPARGSKKKTLAELTALAIGREVFPVHRLDRGTTGCCVFALTRFGEQALTEAFRKRFVDKRYIALTAEVDFTKVSVDVKLKRPEPGNDKNKKKVRQRVDPSGKSAITNFRRLMGGSPSLVAAHPLTGRMHQIRVHLAHLGFPIVGDGLYRSQDIPLAQHQLALHAFYISFPRPRGGRSFVMAPPPPLFVARMPDGGDKELERYRESLEQKRDAHEKRAEKRSTGAGTRKVKNKGPKTNRKKKEPESDPGRNKKRGPKSGAKTGQKKKTAGPKRKKGPQKGPRGRPAAKVLRNKERRKKGTRGGNG